MSDFPRRHRVDLWTPAEAKISDAINYVERAGCDPRLTEAVVLLGEAKDKVADFVDGVELPVLTLPPGVKYTPLEDKPLHPVGVSLLVTRQRLGVTEVLMAKRKNNSGAGLLSTPGGRIELKETRFEAAQRELYEETGASIMFEKLEDKELGVRERFAFGDHYFMFYFHVQQWIGADSKPNGSFENRIPEKSEDWAWIPLDTLKLEETTEPGDILAKLRNTATLIDPMGSSAPKCLWSPK